MGKVFMYLGLAILAILIAFGAYVLNNGSKSHNANQVHRPGVSQGQYAPPPARAVPPPTQGGEPSPDSIGKLKLN